VREELDRILSSGYLVQGNRVRDLEDRIGAFLGGVPAVAVSSGTAALHLSLMVLGVRAGDTVVVPAFTFPATANVVEHLGARVCFVDVDPATFNISAPCLEPALAGARAVIPVHLFGVPADMDAVTEIAARSGAKVVEDAACAMGATFRGRMCGTIGDLGIYSFHPRKLMTTGEGGLVTTRHREHAESLRSLRDHGLTKGQGGRDILAPGLNYRMSELHAALGLASLGAFSHEIAERQRLASFYEAGLARFEGLGMQSVPQGGKRVYQSFTVLLSGTAARDEVIAAMWKMGVETTTGTYGVHLLTYYREKYGIAPRDFPAATMLDARALTLPLHSGMREEDVGYVLDCLGRVLER
jgi:dTDP-4-amino-4,6-dideoxygalactose transaminase